MNVTACVIPPVVGVTVKGAVEELRSLGMAAVFYQDFEALTGDGGPSFPSSCSGTVHQGITKNTCGINVHMFIGGFIYLF